VWEFTHSHRSQGWLILETASVSYGKATTYLPVIELLRSYFGIEPRDDERKMRENVTGKLLSLERTLEPTLAVFLSLLDVLVEDAEWTKLDPSQRKRRTLDALKRLLLRESQVQPVLLVVEDLHWIDSETQAWLDLLVESLPTARLLLLVNYRPEYRHGWGSKTYYQQVRLDALSAASADELMAVLLGTGSGLDDLRRLLIDRTQGNPFFLEESVRALVETGTLTGERGAYRLVAPIQGLQLPATAHAILAARMPPSLPATLPSPLRGEVARMGGVPGSKRHGRSFHCACCSASAWSSQYDRPMSRYIITARARCSPAVSRLPRRPWTRPMPR
jgi:predicted ATPase